ncbi:GDSL-type esterase/lipase family protein [Curtobacterium sp. VKM Ac-2887]|uniref:GDSL-type esterase/lipase family protein n=1 Tax=Curtobacterium sp. VKM Ac-2887 TaxID=2783819 RepID=UPI00188BF515|nr:GDSL-type esterase/lipase family protein [Curtobacterium sp. VKM Ac-2887]MBF4588288.1 GDSL family lipase [Curtobacterium sp. VKM Ac-2887]
MDSWVTGWVRPMADVRAFADQVEDVTLRYRVMSGATGSRVRFELSNVFGDGPLVVGGAALTVDGESVQASFSGKDSTVIAAGMSVWADPVVLPTRTSAEIVVDVYVPESAVLSSGNFARVPVEVSVPGDHVGAAHFPAIETPTMPAPDGTEMAIPAPFLRSVQVDSGTNRVIACLGDSITAGGWPEFAAELLRDTGAPVVLNLGIAGNRLRIDPAPEIASFGRAGLTRFDDDVLEIGGVTDVVIALGTNDLGLPGAAAPISELPTVEDLVDAYTDLISRAGEARLRVTIATITPFLGAEGLTTDRDRLRIEVNEWIREHAPHVADFDKALRSSSDSSRLADEYDSGDHLHPNEDGERHLAATIAAALRDQR